MAPQLARVPPTFAARFVPESLCEAGRDRVVVLVRLRRRGGGCSEGCGGGCGGRRGGGCGGAITVSRRLGARQRRPAGGTRHTPQYAPHRLPRRPRRRHHWLWACSHPFAPCRRLEAAERWAAPSPHRRCIPTTSETPSRHVRELQPDLWRVESWRTPDSTCSSKAWQARAFCARAWRHCAPFFRPSRRAASALHSSLALHWPRIRPCSQICVPFPGH